MSTAPSASPRRERRDTPAPTNTVSALYRDFKLGIEYRPIGTLKHYATNPRSHSRQQLKVLSNSIGAFGFVAPVIVDESDTVVGGHGVLLAAKELGTTTKKDTVNAALDFVVNRRMRLEVLLDDAHGLGVGSDITDPEIMRQARR